jgi:hypothetical protein
MTNARGLAIKRLALIVLGGVAGVAVGLAGVYGIARLTGNAAVEAACKPAVETARRMAPLARGEVAAVAVATAPKHLPALAFDDGSGARKGDLVRALPQGNAGAGCLAGQARQPRVRGCFH